MVPTKRPLALSTLSSKVTWAACFSLAEVQPHFLYNNVVESWRNWSTCRREVPSYIPNQSGTHDGVIISFDKFNGLNHIISRDWLVEMIDSAILRNVSFNDLK